MSQLDYREIASGWGIYTGWIVRERAFTCVFARELGCESWHEWPLQFHELILKLCKAGQPVCQADFCNQVERFVQAVHKAKAASDVSLGGK